MLLSDYDWDNTLDIHDVIVIRSTRDYLTDQRLMWRGYGRFTNLTSGSEWFVEDSRFEFAEWERV